MKLWKLALIVAIVLFFFVLGVFGSSAPAPERSVENPPPGGATVWYLGHCGYAVRTQNHFLIFDY